MYAEKRKSTSTALITGVLLLMSQVIHYHYTSWLNDAVEYIFYNLYKYSMQMYRHVKNLKKKQWRSVGVYDLSNLLKFVTFSSCITSVMSLRSWSQMLKTHWITEQEYLQIDNFNLITLSKSFKPSIIITAPSPFPTSKKKKNY